MKIGVIGYLGVVGSAVYQDLKDNGHEVIGVDKINRDEALVDVIDTDAVMICVPTPTRHKNDCGETADMSIVEKCIDDLIEVLRYKGTIIIRSTILPGTVNSIIRRTGAKNICYVPEFLKERCALDDVKNQDTIIFGRDHIYHDQKMMDTVFAVFSGKRVHSVRVEVAEFLKYFHNTFNALRISFANTFYEMMRRDDEKYGIMLHLFSELNDYPTDYMEVDKDKRGFGGPCLPKDLKAMENFFECGDHAKPRTINEGYGSFLTQSQEKPKQFRAENNIFRVVRHINSTIPKTTPEGMRNV